MTSTDANGRTHPPHTSRLTSAKPEADDDWMQRAYCANSGDLNAWFPAGNTGMWLQHIEDTKNLCRTQCPVMAECGRLLAHLEEQVGSVDGIWAGTSEADRMSAKRREQRQAAKARYDEKRQAAA